MAEHDLSDDNINNTVIDDTQVDDQCNVTERSDNWWGAGRPAASCRMLVLVLARCTASTRIYVREVSVSACVHACMHALC